MESFELALGKVILDGAIALIAILLWRLDLLDKKYNFYIEKLIDDYIKDPRDITYLKNAFFLSKVEYLDYVKLQPNDKSFLMSILKSSVILKTSIIPLLISLLILGFITQCYGLTKF
jgi:hypothetical protein